MNNNGKNSFYAIDLGIQLGLMVALPMVGFLALGVFLDRKLGTSPTFIIASVVVGLTVSILDISYFILPFLNKKVQNKQQ